MTQASPQEVRISRITIIGVSHRGTTKTTGSIVDTITKDIAKGEAEVTGVKRACIITVTRCMTTTTMFQLRTTILDTKNMEDKAVSIMTIMDLTGIGQKVLVNPKVNMNKLNPRQNNRSNHKFNTLNL